MKVSWSHCVLKVYDLEPMVEFYCDLFGWQVADRGGIGEQEIVERCIYGLVTEGARILEEGIANRSADIDVVWMNGYGFPRHRGGPMHYADSVGLDKVYATVCDFEKRFGSMYWEPPALLRELAESGRKFADL